MILFGFQASRLRRLGRTAASYLSKSFRGLHWIRSQLDDLVSLKASARAE